MNRARLSLGAMSFDDASIVSVRELGDQRVEYTVQPLRFKSNEEHNLALKTLQPGGFIMTRRLMLLGPSRLAYSLTAPIILCLGLLLQISTGSVLAQVTQTIGPGSLGTQVNQVGNVYEITHGTPAGSNLFHSFGDFSLTAAETALFQTTTGTSDTAIGNILGRVTGGNPSSIFGTIDSVSYYPNANLFLMNPEGILFGPNATLNVAGSVAFTTANYIRLFDGVSSAMFYADPGSDAVTAAGRTSILSSAPLVDFGFVTPAAFGFLTSPPAAITVHGSTLTVSADQSFTLVGGDITVAADPDTGTTSTLQAPAGEIRLASVASPGEVLLSSLQTGPNINGESFTAMGTVQLTEGTSLDVTDNDFAVGGRGGTVRIRGGQFTLDNSLIFANTLGDVDGNQTALSVNVQSDVNITNGSGIFVTGGGTGRAGDIDVTGQNVRFEGGSFAFTSNVDAADVGGNIAINSTTLSFLDGSALLAESTGTSGGGSVTVHSTDSLSLSGEDAVGNVSRIQTIANGSGNGGTLSVTGGSVNINGGGIQTVSTYTGNAGDLTLDLTGKITITGGGGIHTRGDAGASGNLNVTADTISISGQSGPFNRSHIENIGGATLTGNTVITARQFLLTDSARINIQSNLGQAGTLTIKATESATITNQAKVRMDTSGVGGGLMKITAQTITIDQGILQTRTSGAGDAAAVNLMAGNATITGGQINSQTAGNGRGGTVTVNVAEKLMITGQFAGSADDIPGPAGIFTNAFATGNGGNIDVTAGQSVTLTNGASISASSTGSGNAGNIEINAGNRFEARNSSVTTKSEQAGGGNIEINARDRFRLVNSQVNASAFLDGGNITIDPRLVLLQNSQILAQSIHGNGGNITITTPLFLSDQSSFVSASSQFGLNGTVTIQKPTSNLSGSLGTLTSKPSQAQSLLTQRCAALANGQASSFVVAGREQLPADPGSWLTSPLYAAGTGLGVKAEGVKAEGERLGTGEGITADDTDAVSLRRLTPARFLIANFADSEATGCHS